MVARLPDHVTEAVHRGLRQGVAKEVLARELGIGIASIYRIQAGLAIGERAAKVRRCGVCRAAITTDTCRACKIQKKGTRMTTESARRLLAALEALGVNEGFGVPIGALGMLAIACEPVGIEALENPPSSPNSELQRLLTRHDVLWSQWVMHAPRVAAALRANDPIDD